MPTNLDEHETDDARNKGARQMRELQRWQQLCDLLHESHWRQGELASRLGVALRTVQRDLDVIEARLSIEGDGGPRNSIPRDVEGRFFLRPEQQPFSHIELKQDEARVLLFALRHLLHNSRENEKGAFGLLKWLANSFPGAVASAARVTTEQAAQLPLAPKKGVAQMHVIRVLTGAWQAQSLVHLSYQKAEAGAGTTNYCFQPVLFEPSATNGATYVLGCILQRGTPQFRSFKLDRIRSVKPHDEVCPDGKQHQVIPPEGVLDLLPKIAETAARSWSGIVISEESFDVAIRFRGDAVQPVREMPWRSMVDFQKEPGGALLMRGRFSQWWDMIPWILGWGANAEVLGPPELRAEVASRVKGAAELY